MTLSTHIHHRSFSWRGTSTAIKNGWVKFVLWALTSPISEKMRSSKCYPQVSKMPTLTYWRAAFLKEHRVLTFIYNVFNLRDTEVAICIMCSCIKKSRWF